MKNNINKKIGATLLSAAIMAGTAVIPMSNAAVEAKVNNVPSIKISAHVQDIGWMDPVEAKEGNVVGTFWQQRRVEAMKFDLRNCPGVTLSIVAHVQDHGDMEFTVGAEDYDKLVGTQWEQRRMEAITITSNGLHEQGYKLQYRAHVQDHGWLPWVEEGQMGGTRWEQRRVEAIEMRIVAINDVAVAKTEAIAKLNSYDIALSDYDTNSVPETTYKRLSNQIKETIALVNTANNEEQVKEILEEQVKKLNRYVSPSKMEDVVKATEEAYDKALTAINEKIADYEEYIPNSEYSVSEKQRLYAIIADTKAKIADAKTATTIGKETDATSAKTIFGELKKLVTPVFDLDAKLGTYKDLVKAQNKANVALTEYEKAVRNSNIANEYKTIAYDAIDVAEEEIRVAKIDGEVTAATSKLETQLNGTVYNNVVRKAKNEIAKNEAVVAKTEAEELLEEYLTCGYEDIEKTAERYIRELNALDNANTISVNAENYEVELKSRFDDNEKYRKQYETNKKDAMLKLNASIDAIDELELSNEDVESIMRMVEATKTSIEQIAISKDDDVAAAPSKVKPLTDEFESYMSTYHRDANKKIKEYQFNETKSNALLTIGEYLDSDNKTIKKLATDAEKVISPLKFNTTTVTGNMTTISTTLSKTIDKIEVEISREEALRIAENILDELQEYLSNDEYQVNKLANEAIITINGKVTSIKNETSDGTQSITAITNIEGFVSDIEDERKNTMDQITTIMNANSVEIAKRLTAAKEKAEKEISKYIELAQDVENESLESQLNTYLSQVRGASNINVVNNIVSLNSDGTLASCLLNTLIQQTDSKLTVKAEALKTLEEKFKVLYTTAADNSTVIKDADGNVVENELIKNDVTIKNTIESIKNKIKTTTSSLTINGCVDETDSTKDLGKLYNCVAALKTAIATETGKLELTVANVTTPLLSNKLQNITNTYIERIKNVTYTEYFKGTNTISKEDTTLITNITAEGIVAVKAEIVTELTAYATEEYAKLTAPTNQFSVVEAEIAKIDFTKNISGSALTTVDELVAVAIAAKANIDSKIA